jgi:hypothetical protein
MLLSRPSGNQAVRKRSSRNCLSKIHQRFQVLLRRCEKFKAFYMLWIIIKLIFSRHNRTTDTIVESTSLQRQKKFVRRMSDRLKWKNSRRSSEIYTTRWRSRRRGAETLLHSGTSNRNFKFAISNNFDVNLETFLSIIQCSYSLSTLLKHITEMAE